MLLSTSCCFYFSPGRSADERAKKVVCDRFPWVLKAWRYHTESEKQYAFNYEWLFFYIGKNYHKLILPSTVLDTVVYWHNIAATNEEDKIWRCPKPLWSFLLGVFVSLINLRSSIPTVTKSLFNMLLFWYTTRPSVSVPACPKTNLMRPLGLSSSSLPRGFQLCYLPPNPPIQPLSISQIDWAAAPQTEVSQARLKPAQQTAFGYFV